MNIAFFLTPKKDVVYQYINSTMRQAIERMEYHRYSAIPIIDEKGCYVCTLTEGDLLRKLKDTKGLRFEDTCKILLSEIQMQVINKPVRIDCNIEDLFSAAINQNFIPVIDDDNRFIGIIKRSDIINYGSQKLFGVSKKEA